MKKCRILSDSESVTSLTEKSRKWVGGGFNRPPKGRRCKIQGGVENLARDSPPFNSHPASPPCTVHMCFTAAGQYSVCFKMSICKAFNSTGESHTCQGRSQRKGSEGHQFSAGGPRKSSAEGASVEAP